MPGISCQGYINNKLRVIYMSQAKLYVGNLSYNTTEDELRNFFAQYGEIQDIKIIVDFHSGRSKGFAFVTYASDQDCENALAANGKDLGSRKLRVNVAREDNQRSGGGPGGRGKRPEGRRPFRNDRDRDRM